MFLGTLVDAVVNSVILALLALGFNLTFGVSGISNFAYGAFYVLTGFLAWILFKTVGLPYFVAAGLTVLAAALLGALMYRVVLLRVRGLPLSEVISTFGIGLIILELLRNLGFVGFQYSLPVFYDDSVELFGTVLDVQRVVIVVLGVVLAVLLWLFTHHTRTGLAFRGIAQQPETALSLGIDPDRIATISVAAGCGLAALSAILILPLGTISVAQGYDVLLNALAVSIVGGLGSIGGAVLAGFLIGFAQTFTATYLENHWVMVVPLVAILAVLAVKPSGLLGKQKELEERI
jgi:branched-chain amino acid transport system permease protein